MNITEIVFGPACVGRRFFDAVNHIGFFVLQIHDVDFPFLLLIAGIDFFPVFKQIKCLFKLTRHNDLSGWIGHNPQVIPDIF